MRVAGEKAKQKVAVKRQEEEQKKRLEEEARLKKIQQAVRHPSYIRHKMVEWCECVSTTCITVDD